MLMDALAASWWVGANAMYDLLRLASPTESDQVVSDFIECAKNEYGNLEFSDFERAQAIRIVIQCEIPKELFNRKLRLPPYTKAQSAAMFKSHELLAEASRLAHHSDYSQQSYGRMMDELLQRFPDFSREQCEEVLGSAMISMR